MELKDKAKTPKEIIKEVLENFEYFNFHNIVNTVETEHFILKSKNKKKK